jgi:hypothetical protein
MNAEIDSVVAGHSAIASVQDIGSSSEVRVIRAIKISDNVGSDESEPEVLFTAHQHAREHLTVETSLYILHLLADNYGTDPWITQHRQLARGPDRPRRQIRTAASTTSRPAATARRARTASRTPARARSAPT